MNQIEILKKSLQREREARKRAEQIIASKTQELNQVNRRLVELNRALEKKIEERSREIEILSRFPDESPNPVLRYTAEGQLIFSNLPAKRFLQFLDNLKTKSKSHFFQELPRALSHNITIELELEGPDIAYQVYLSPQKNGSHVNVYATDASEVKKAKKFVDMLKIWMDFSNDAIHVANESGALVFVNKVATERIGFTQEELLSKNVRDIEGIFKQSPGLWDEHVRDLKVKKSMLMEGQILRKDGTTFPVEVSIRYMKVDEQGYVVAFIRDITERKIVQDQLNQQRQFYESILNSIPTDIAVFNPEHRYLFVNPEAVKNPEIRNWIIGKDDFDYCREFNKDYDQARVRRHLFDQSVKEKKVTELEEDFKDENGQKLFKLRRFRPIWDENGQLKLMIGYGLDITSRKKIEQQLMENQRLLRGINHASHLLITSPQLENGIKAALESVGEASGVDRIYLFENHYNEEGQMLMSQRYEWTKQGIEPQIDNPDLLNIPYEIVFPRWFDLLSRKQPVKGLISSFPELERIFLERQEILSILVIPVFINRQYWGFIGFDDCTCSRIWNDTEENILYNLANTIGGAIERHRAEKVVFEHKDRLDKALRGSNDGLFDFNLETNLVYCSPRMLELLRIEHSQTGSDLKILELKERIHPDDFESVLEEIESSIQELRSFNLETRLLGDDGEYRWFNCRGDIEMKASAKPIRLAGFVTDITDRKIAQMNLQKSEEDLNLAQQIAHIGNWHFELKTHRIKWSRELYHIYGLDPDHTDLQLSDVMEQVHPEDKDQFYNNVQFALSENLPTRQEYRLIRPDGSVRFIESNSQPLFDKGELAGLFGTAMDITERKLSEIELAKAKELAEASVRAKELFLANMSHEIRTPLNGIIGLIGLFEKTRMDSEQIQLLSTLKNSSENLLVIINDILDFAKIEAGKFDLEKTFFNLFKTISKSLQIYQFKSEEKNIRLVKEFDYPSNLVVKGDSVRLNQVLGNLLSNSVKFTEPGGKIVFRVEKSFEDQHFITLVFMVSDTGIGIPREKQDQIFSAFSQLHSHRYGGTGLGLSISKNLIELQGGKIWLAYSSHKGTEFRFTLTYEKAADQILQNEVTRIYDYHSLGALKVLLAEDNEINRFLATSILKNWGFEVEHALNGREAYLKAAENNYDLILMDIQMPELSGIEVTRMIRKLPDPVRSKVPILALTANAIKGDREKYMEAGMNDYQSKPFREDQLFSKISMLLNGRVEHLKIEEKGPTGPLKTEKPGFSLNKLRASGINDPAFMQKMISIFLETAPVYLHQMRKALKEQEWQLLGKTAHSLKPTLDMLDVHMLQDEIRKLEAGAGNGMKKDELTDLAQNVITNLEKLIGFIREEINFEKNGDVDI
jgi:PAS domain S-box-containing protein